MTRPDDTPIFWAVVDDLRRGGHRHHWQRTWFSPRDERVAAAPPPERHPLVTSPIRIPRGATVTDPEPTDPVAETAGEQDHSDPWALAGDDATAPTSTDDDVATWGGA